jgi:hypothetical protein
MCARSPAHARMPLVLNIRSILRAICPRPHPQTITDDRDHYLPPATAIANVENRIVYGCGDGSLTWVMFSR